MCRPEEASVGRELLVHCAQIGWWRNSSRKMSGNKQIFNLVFFISSSLFTKRNAIFKKKKTTMPVLLLIKVPL